MFGRGNITDVNTNVFMNANVCIEGKICRGGGALRKAGSEGNDEDE